MFCDIDKGGSQMMYNNLAFLEKKYFYDPTECCVDIQHCVLWLCQLFLKPFVVVTFKIKFEIVFSPFLHGQA